MHIYLRGIRAPINTIILWSVGPDVTLYYTDIFLVQKHLNGIAANIIYKMIPTPYRNERGGSPQHLDRRGPQNQRRHCRNKERGAGILYSTGPHIRDSLFVILCRFGQTGTQSRSSSDRRRTFDFYFLTFLFYFFLRYKHCSASLFFSSCIT